MMWFRLKNADGVPSPALIVDVARIEENTESVVFVDPADLKTVLRNAQKSRKVRMLEKAGHVYAIRLTMEEDEMPENPYAGMELAPRESDDEFAFVKSWSLHRRVKLLHAVAASVDEDMAAFKLGVMAHF